MKLYFSPGAKAQLKGGGTVFLALILFVSVIAISRPVGLYASLKEVSITPTVVLDAGHGGLTNTID